MMWRKTRGRDGRSLLTGGRRHPGVQSRGRLTRQEGDGSLRRTWWQSPWPSHGAVEGVSTESDVVLLRVEVLASQRRARRHRRGCGRGDHWSWGFPSSVHKVLQVRRCVRPLVAWHLSQRVERLLFCVCRASTTVAGLDRRTLNRLKAAPGARATMFSKRGRPPHLPFPLPVADLSGGGAGHRILWLDGECHVP